MLEGFDYDGILVKIMSIFYTSKHSVGGLVNTHLTMRMAAPAPLRISVIGGWAHPSKYTKSVLHGKALCVGLHMNVCRFKFC